MKKKNLLGIEILAVILLLGVVLVSAGSIRETYRTDKVIVALGDSLTSGFGVSPDKRFITILSKEVNIPIINSGVSGDTTAMALKRIDHDVLSYRPDIVLVLLGGNDYLRQVPKEETFSNIAKIVSIIKSKGAKVILIGVNKSILPDYEASFQQIAIDERVAGYVPDVLNGLGLRKEMMHDQVHPNELGHKVIASRILPVLEGILK